MLAAHVLRMERREHAGWLKDHAGHQRSQRGFPRRLRRPTVLLRHYVHHVAERKIARQSDTAARDELVEREIVEHRRNLISRRREQRWIAIGLLLGDRMLHRALFRESVGIPKRLL